MTDDIPDELSVYKLIQSHVVEINSLKKQCKTKQCKQNLQRIPRHMRRRAASNNPKRLPKSLQNFSSKLDLNVKKKKKTKSRKVGTRNKDPRRTLLHMWFAKRFKLVPKWNTLIPYKNNGKNQRLLHRCGKNGYSVFYLPFVKSFLFDYSNSSKDYIFDILSHFCSPNDMTLLINLKNGNQCTIHLYEFDQFPSSLIGPLRFVLIEKQNSIWITAHICILDHLTVSVFSRLTEKSIVIRQDLPFSHIRLYGAKANQHLNRVFFHKQLLNSEHVPLDEFNCFQVKSKDKISEIKTSVELSDFIEQSTDLNGQSEKNDQSTIVAFRKLLIGHTEGIDLIVENEHLKAIWNRITENMSHLVGGLRDFEVMTVETCSTFFPTVGYFDLKINQNLVKGFNLENKFVIRDKNIVDSLSNLSIEALTNIERKESATVYVTIDYLKGTPKQNDLIYLPSRNVLESCLNDGKFKSSEVNAGIELISAIGFVEYGSYSLEAAKCRAIAVISLLALEKMIRDQRNMPSLHNKLYALVKSTFNYVNLVTVSVINPMNLT